MQHLQNVIKLPVFYNIIINIIDKIISNVHIASYEDHIIIEDDLTEELFGIQNVAEFVM